MGDPRADELHNTVKVSRKRATRRLAVYMHLLRMVLDQLQEITRQLVQISSALGIAEDLNNNDDRKDSSKAGE